MTNYTLCLIAAITFLYSSVTTPSTFQADQEIKALYKTLPPKLSFSKKFDKISAYFKSRPYTLGPLGEGKKGIIDADPLYRTDRFDCTTYVSTVLALANSDDLNAFKKNIIDIRYKKQKISFLERNHFMTIDWNVANGEKGYIKDITNTIKNKKGDVISKKATSYFNKTNWYKHIINHQRHLLKHHKSLSSIKKLEKLTTQITSKYGSINYLPLSALYNKDKTPNTFLFNQIPSNTIIEIVRPNWDIKNRIGTNINVSHIGFGIRKNGILYFREASTIYKKVIDTKLEDYLKKFLTSSTIKGINIQKILHPKKHS